MLKISRNVLHLKNLPLDAVFVVVLSKFPHYWVFSQYIFRNLESLSSEQVAREVSIHLNKAQDKNNGILPGCECHIYPQSHIDYII